MTGKVYSLDDQYSLKEIRNLDDFEKLKTLWDELAEKQNTFTPFLCFDWFKIWLEHFLQGNKMLILLLCKEDEIATIAPFLIKEERFKGINIRKIELIGNVYSPIRYLLFSELDNGEKEKNLSSLFKFFSKIYNDWDILDLYSIPEENASFDILKKAIGETAFKYNDYFCFGDHYLDEINYSGEEYLKRRPGNISKNVPYRLRRLKKIGELEFRLIKNNDDIDRYMDVYYELYSRSWQKRENTGPTFHRSLAKMIAAKGWLRLGFLFFDHSPMACQFWICANQQAYILKLFYDESYQQYAPGKILTAEMMKYVIDIDKVKVIDYLHGDENYKKDWTPKFRERRGIMVFNQNIKARYLAFLNNRILPAINENEYLKKMKEMILNRLR
jgi:CelD/BcsL family acetyltransferase involved in cellulose biosynthesis